jgi:hypothetical protein
VYRSKNNRRIASDFMLKVSVSRKFALIVAFEFAATDALCRRAIYEESQLRDGGNAAAFSDEDCGVEPERQTHLAVRL